MYRNGTLDDTDMRMNSNTTTHSDSAQSHGQNDFICYL